MKTAHAFILALGLLAAGPALAHDDLKPEHGGLIVETSAGMRVELVATSGSAEIYLTDHSGKAVAAAAMSGKAVMLVNGKKVEVPLGPAGDNKLSGNALPAPVSKTNPAIISIEGQGKKVSARFGG